MDTTFVKSLWLEDFFEHNHRRKGREIAQLIMGRYYPGVSDGAMISAFQLIQDIKTSDYGKIFLTSMNRLQTEVLYASSIHGQNHIERVAVLSAWLAIKKEIPQELFSICMECAKYHDVGRNSDEEDREHGKRGADLVGKICGTYNVLEQNMIAAVIAAHSLEDREAEAVFSDWKIDANTGKICKLLLQILKDADALDRFRLNNDSLNIELLRCNESRQLIQVACEMVNF